MLRRRAPFLLLPALLAACDNVGRAFDPNLGGGGGSTGPGTGIQTALAGGISVNGKPRVDAVYPQGAGWPSSVPIVVVFNESIAEDTIAPPAGGSGAPGLYVRAPGTTTALPASYDFLLGDQVVVIRPLTPLPDTQGSPYEVVIEPTVTDADAVALGGTPATVLATFFADEDAGKQTPGEDGRIVTVLPRDRERDAPRESDVYLIFTRAANRTSVTNANFVLRDAAGTTVPGKISFPIATGPAVDGRVLLLDPTADLAGSTDYEVVVDATITFGNAGKLDFENRTPFARFKTLPFRAASSVAVGNATPGFPDRVNQSNLETLRIDAAVEASAVQGDTVTVRLYGLDRKTANATDVAFVERSARLGASGAQTITVDFTGQLGSVASPRFADGPLTIAAQLSRGSQRAGYTLHASTSQPSLDVTLPALKNVGPATGASTLDLLVDQQHVAFYGQANEQLGTAMLTAAGATLSMFGAEAGGGFVMLPLDLGLRTDPLTYQLTIADAAGNLSPTVYQGSIVPRGVVTGSAGGGTLVVEAYDDATLLAIAGALVLVEPGLPQKPAVGRVAGTTGADGRSTFSMPPPRSTITIVAAGYELKTLLDTGAGFVSLGLRPRARATATLAGTAAFVPSVGQSVLVGCNALDDPLEEDTQTSTTAPTAIPATAIRPNRPLALTAFAGTFEPSTVPSFAFAGCRMCGVSGVTPTAPAAPVAPAASASEAVTLLPIAFNTLNLATPYPADFGLAAGLDLANLAGTPTVRVVGNLRGFAGMTLFGVGYASGGAGGLYTVNGTYALSTTLNLSGYAPVLYASTEARDQSGNVSRHRALLDNLTGLVFPILDPPDIPAIAPPGGPSTGAPAVTYEDRLDTSLLLGSFGFVELTATDAAGARWTLLRQDVNGAIGATTIQWPDLTGLGVVGLANGTWTVRAETHLLLSASFAADSYVLEEMRRQQAGYARAASVSFTVQ